MGFFDKIKKGNKKDFSDFDDGCLEGEETNDDAMDIMNDAETFLGSDDKQDFIDVDKFGKRKKKDNLDLDIDF